MYSPALTHLQSNFCVAFFRRVFFLIIIRQFFDVSMTESGNSATLCCGFFSLTNLFENVNEAFMGHEELKKMKLL